jgi:hypothetical protein
MRLRINDFLSRNESPVITLSRMPPAKTGPHRRAASGRVERPGNSDSASDYGRSLRQTQRDDLRLS